MAAHITDTLEKLGFVEDGLYFVREERDKNFSNVKFSIMNNQLTCYDGHEIIFMVSTDITLGPLLCLFENFNVIHERYIYETLDFIVEQFQNQD